jgi:hypothetical protein
MKRFLVIIAALMIAAGPASSGSLTLLGAGGPPAAPPSGPTIINTDSDPGTGQFGQLVFTYTGKSIGTASAGRYVIVTSSTVGHTITGIVVTPNVGSPVSLTQMTQLYNYVNTWWGPVPTGTTATIAMTISSTGDELPIIVDVSTGVTSAGTPATSDATTNPLPVGPITVPASGIGFVALQNFNTNTFTPSWSNVTGLGTVEQAAYTTITAGTTTPGSVTPSVANPSGNRIFGYAVPLSP